MTLKETLTKATLMTKTANEEHAVFWLLLELLNFSKSDYFINEERILEKKFIKKYFKLVDEHLNKNIPVQYLVRQSYFYNYKFIVSKDTLVPRVETEELVYRTIKYINEYFENYETLNILDLATGSGAIGITLKLELKKVNVTLADVNKKALRIARKNTKNYHLKIKTIKSNWFDKITDKFDVIISNPPYIPIGQHVEEKTLNEPKIALFSGGEGLDSYQAILSTINNNINDKAIIAFEHGYDQKTKLKELIKANLSDYKLKQEKDLSNKDRYTFIFYNKKEATQ